MPTQERNFLDYVQQHERTWGNESYAGKPDLQDLLAAKIVVFWVAIGTERNIKSLPRYTATLHKDLSAVEAYFSKLLFRAQIEPPKQRVAQIFSEGKKVGLKGVKMEFEIEN
jgi:hypothetical protein